MTYRFRADTSQAKLRKNTPYRQRLWRQSWPASFFWPRSVACQHRWISPIDSIFANRWIAAGRAELRHNSFDGANSFDDA
jgi:hypothetical protein